MIFFYFFFCFIVNCNFDLNKFFFIIENKLFFFNKVNYNNLFFFSLKYFSNNYLENNFFNVKDNIFYYNNLKTLLIFKKKNINSIYKIYNTFFFLILNFSDNNVTKKNKFLYDIFNSFIKYIENNNNIIKNSNFHLFKNSISNKSEKCGLGIVFKKILNGILILDIILNTPIYNSCIKANDLIVGINFFLINNLSVNSIKKN